MKLYGHPRHPCTRKVLLTLAEKGARAELVTVDLASGEHTRGEHAARHPFAGAIALDHDGFVLHEAHAIMQYLDAELAGPRLTPREAAARASMQQWLDVCVKYLEPEAAKLCAQLQMAPLYGLEPDLGSTQEAQRELDHVLAVLDGVLTVRPYVAGVDLTLADLALLPSLDALFTGERAELLSRHVAVQRWWGSLRTRPSYRAVRASEGPEHPLEPRWADSLREARRSVLRAFERSRAAMN